MYHKPHFFITIKQNPFKKYYLCGKFVNIPEDLKKIYLLLSFFLSAVFITAQEGTAPSTPTSSPELQSNTTPATTGSANTETLQVAPVRKKKVIPPPPPPAETVLQVSAPTGNNPFDIGLSVRQASGSNILPDSTTVTGRPNITGTGNPFDIGSSGAPQQSQPVPKPDPVAKADKKMPSNSFVFGIILGMLLLLSIAVSLNRFILRNLYQAFLNDASFRQALKDRVSFGWSPFIMLYILFLVNAGIFVYLLTMHNGISTIKVPRLVWLEYCILGVSAVFLLKLAVLSYIGYVFPVAKESSSYRFLMIIFGIILGLFLVPVNIFLAFSQEATGDWLIILSLILIAALYIFRSFRSLVIATRFLAFHKLHFLLYLCTVEVAPLIILTKLIYQNI